MNHEPLGQQSTINRETTLSFAPLRLTVGTLVKSVEAQDVDRTLLFWERSEVDLRA